MYFELMCTYTSSLYVCIYKRFCAGNTWMRLQHVFYSDKKITCLPLRGHVV